MSAEYQRLIMAPAAESPQVAGGTLHPSQEQGHDPDHQHQLRQPATTAVLASLAFGPSFFPSLPAPWLLASALTLAVPTTHSPTRSPTGTPRPTR